MKDLNVKSRASFAAPEIVFGRLAAQMSESFNFLKKQMGLFPSEDDKTIFAVV